MSANGLVAASLALRAWLSGCSALATTTGPGCVTCSSTGVFENPFKASLPPVYGLVWIVASGPGFACVCMAGEDGAAPEVVTMALLVAQPPSTRVPRSPAIPAQRMRRWLGVVMPFPPSTGDRWSWFL